MNSLGQVCMTEVTGETSSYSGDPPLTDVPQAMEGLHDTSPPPFLTKICNLVDDPNTNHIVSWSKGNNSFVVWDPESFAIHLLPKYFKHSNLSSFIRQLNTYGFRKVDPDKLEFASEWFLRGQKHLLKHIKRRKPQPFPQNISQSLDTTCLELGQFGQEEEIDRLRRDKQVLMVELVKLKLEHQETKAHIKALEHRLEGTEKKQQHIMGFLARMIQNPSFVRKLVQNKRFKQLEGPISSKRRDLDHDLCNVEVSEFVQGEGEISVELTTMDYGDIEVPKMKVLPMNIQVPSGSFEERKDGGHKSLDKVFWEELLNDGNEEHYGLFGIEAVRKRCGNVS